MPYRCCHRNQSSSNFKRSSFPKITIKPKQFSLAYDFAKSLCNSLSLSPFPFCFSKFSVANLVFTLGGKLLFWPFLGQFERKKWACFSTKQAQILIIVVKIFIDCDLVALLFLIFVCADALPRGAISGRPFCVIYSRLTIQYNISYSSNWNQRKWLNAKLKIIFSFAL